MLASSPTMSASGTDHTSGTSAKMSKPSPGPTEWINVSVVYGPPEVEKKRIKTSPSVPIPRGSFCSLIDHTNMSKGRKLYHAKCFRKAGTQGSLLDSSARLSKPQTGCFVSLPARALRSHGNPDIRNTVSVVTLCDLRMHIGKCG